MKQITTYLKKIDKNKKDSKNEKKKEKSKMKITVILKQFICFYCFVFSGFFIPYSYGYDCLPEKCQFESVYDFLFKSYYKETTAKKMFSIICDIKDDSFDFKYNNDLKKHITDKKCDNYGNLIHFKSIIFRWTSSNDLITFDKRFLNIIPNSINYFFYFPFLPLVRISFWDLKGFDVSIFEKGYLENLSKGEFSLKFEFFWLIIEVANSRLDFYHNKKKINSCQDISDSNLTRIDSIFQVGSFSKLLFKLRFVEYNENMCPLFFMNTNVTILYVENLIDTFYKKRILSFSNETLPKLNSNINEISINKANNINVDLSLFHPSVFNNTFLIDIEDGTLNSIDGGILKNLKQLSEIRISIEIFKKINHDK